MLTQSSPCAAHSARSTFRAHPLDGAMLYFHARTGTHVRVESDATRAFARQAPRAVMFGITNACNLRCSFCSRDAAHESRWTHESAVRVLSGLANAGALEVAFGGGEPFAFRGFADLLVELYETTPLALNVTTNGTLLDAPTLSRLHSVLGQVRMSLYDETPWRDAAMRLASADQLWGANVLVDDAALARLPALLHELATLRCHDVSLLSYVGPDPSKHLSRKGDARLAAIVGDSPLPTRLSVCFGDRIAAPLLFRGFDDRGDCGAGYDFVTITSRKTVQACSFRDDGFAIESADDVLRVWRSKKESLATTSPRLGCARAHATPHEPSATQRTLRVWQGFSGNNSGECIMVAKFETADDANRYLAELLPHYTPDETYSAPWQTLFREEGVATDDASPGTAPQELLAVGRSVFARGYDSDDLFPELRSFAWKRGAAVLPGGIHVHDGPTVLCAIRCRNANDARAVSKKQHVARVELHVHGNVVFAVGPLSAFDDDTPEPSHLMAAASVALSALAGPRPMAMELFCDDVSADAFVHVMQRLGDEPARQSRLFVGFWSFDEAVSRKRAAHFAAQIDEAPVTTRQSGVLIDCIVRKKRVAVHGHRAGGTVSSLQGKRVLVSAYLIAASPKGSAERVLDVNAVRANVVACIGRELSVESCDVSVTASWTASRASVDVVTDDPARVMILLDAYAREEHLGLSLDVHEHDALGLAVRRLLAEI